MAFGRRCAGCNLLSKAKKFGEALEAADAYLAKLKHEHVVGKRKHETALKGFYAYCQKQLRILEAKRRIEALAAPKRQKTAHPPATVEPSAAASLAPPMPAPAPVPPLPLTRGAPYGRDRRIGIQGGLSCRALQLAQGLRAG